MKSLQDLNPHNLQPVTREQIDNMLILYDRLTKLQDLYGSDLVVTSALRSRDEQDELIRRGKTNAFNSCHLSGCAADLLDQDKKLSNYIKKHVNTMINLQLWFEDFKFTPGWVHAQIIPPHSGKRFFIP